MERERERDDNSSALVNHQSSNRTYYYDYENGTICSPDEIWQNVQGVLDKPQINYNITGDIDDYLKNNNDLNQLNNSILPDRDATAVKKELTTLQHNNTELSREVVKWKDKYNDVTKNLPLDWEIKLREHQEFSQRPNITLEEFAKYKSPEQVKEIEKSVRETVEREFKGFINPINSTALAEHELFTKTQLDEAVKNKAKQKDQEWADKGLINPSNSTALAKHKLFTEDQVKKATTKAIENNNKVWTNKGLINPHNETDLAAANLVKKANLKAVEKERDSRPDINLLRYAELLNKEKTLTNRPNIALTEWENDWSKRPSQKLYDQEKTQHNRTKADLSNAQVKIKLAEEFGLTDWDNLKDRIGNETLTTLLARPTQKELENKTKELDQSNQQVGNLITQLNKLNSDLLNVKESSQFEIVRLKTENENYKEQRDSRPDITFTDYQQLLNDKNNATLTIQGLEKNLNNTRVEFEKYQNATDKTIIEKDTYKNDLTQTQKELTSAKQKIRELEQEKTQALANVENFNQQLDDAQQELVRVQREKIKLAQKYQQEQDQHAKTQTQLKEQTSYLQSILGYLVKAGIATSSWKLGRNYGQGEMIIKHSEDTKKVQKIVQDGINALVQQKNQALQKQKKTEQERDQLQQQIENHHCSSTNSDQSLNKEQIKIIQKNNEQEVIQELNTSFNLNLQNPNLKQVISEIQSRIAKDPVVVEKDFNYAFDTFQTVEKGLTQQTAPFGEDLEAIKDLEIKGLNELFLQQLDQKFITQIRQAQNYQKLVQIRNSFLAKHLVKVQKGEVKIQPLSEVKLLTLTKQNNLERCIWAGLLAASLVGIGILWLKLRKK